MCGNVELLQVQICRQQTTYNRVDHGAKTKHGTTEPTGVLISFSEGLIDSIISGLF